MASLSPASSSTSRTCSARAAKINRAHSPPTPDGFRSTARKTATCKGAKSAVMSRWFTQTCDRREPPEKSPLKRLGEKSAKPTDELGCQRRATSKLFRGRMSGWHPLLSLLLRPFCSVVDAIQAIVTLGRKSAPVLARQRFSPALATGPSCRLRIGRLPRGSSPNSRSS